MESFVLDEVSLVGLGAGWLEVWYLPSSIGT